LLPTLLALLMQLLEAPLTAQGLELSGAARLDYALLEAEPQLRSHQFQPTGGQLRRRSATANEIREIGDLNGLIRLQQKNPGRAPGATTETGLLKLFGLECPRQSPQPIRCISAGWQGANQLQLTLGQHNGLGIEANLQARFAALDGFDNSELGSTRLLDTD
jgi:hypothetical protein